MGFSDFGDPNGTEALHFPTNAVYRPQAVGEGPRRPRVVKESSDSGVELEQAAESVATADGTALGTWRYAWRREEDKVALTLVVPFKMMMIDVFVQRPAQRSFSNQNEFGQAFLPDGTHPALGESIQIRTPGWKGQWPYSA